MGWFKDVFNPSGAEKERYNSAFNKVRKENYPKIEYNYNSWKNVSPTQKIAKCNALDKSVEELKLLKEGKINDALMSDGHRVDERYKKVYTNILNEYNSVYRRRYCDPILDTAERNTTKVKLNIEAQETQKRVEDDLAKQRVLIIGVGSLVLLLGTVFIIRKI
tara:strand:+ start:18066 stop:18554 length:489 start_codon:yes stop_codon:yes gene_type:complete